MSMNLESVCDQFGLTSVSVAYHKTTKHYSAFVHFSKDESRCTEMGTASNAGAAILDALDRCHKARPIHDFVVTIPEQTGVSRHERTA